VRASLPCWRHWSQNAALWPCLLVAVHWAGLLHSWPYVPGSAFWHCFMCGSPVVGTIPATTLREGLALALSCGADRDNPACDTVGLLCFAAVCAKTNDLFAVGALA